MGNPFLFPGGRCCWHLVGFPKKQRQVFLVHLHCEVEDGREEQTDEETGWRSKRSRTPRGKETGGPCSASSQAPWVCSVGSVGLRRAWDGFWLWTYSKCLGMGKILERAYAMELDAFCLLKPFSHGHFPACREARAIGYPYTSH